MTTYEPFELIGTTTGFNYFFGPSDNNPRALGSESRYCARLKLSSVMLDDALWPEGGIFWQMHQGKYRTTSINKDRDFVLANYTHPPLIESHYGRLNRLKLAEPSNHILENEYETLRRALELAKTRQLNPNVLLEGLKVIITVKPVPVNDGVGMLRKAEIETVNLRLLGIQLDPHDLKVRVLQA